MPAIPTKTFALPFSDGVDLRGDPLMVAPPKWAALENCFFDTPSSVAPRSGFARITPADETGAFSQARFVRSRAGSLFVGDGSRVLGGPRYTAFANQAVQLLNARVDTITEAIVAGSVDYDSLYSESIAVGDLQAFAYESTGGFVYLVITYKGSLVTKLQTVEAGAISPRLLLCAGQFCLVYADSGSINLRMFSVPADINSLTAGATIGGTFGGTYPSVLLASDMNANKVYDAEVFGSRIVVAYNSSTANTIKHLLADAGGTVEGTQSITAAGAPVCVACSVTPAGTTYGVAWGVDATNSVYAQMFDRAQAQLFAAATIDATAGTHKRITCVFVSSTSMAIFWDFTAAATYNYLTYHAFVSTGGSVTIGTATTRVFMRHAALASRAWADNGFGYVTLVHVSPLQATYFVCRMGVNFDGSLASPSVDHLTCGRLLYGQASGLPGVDANGSAERSFLPRVSQVASSRTYLVILPYKTIVGNSASKSAPAAFRLTYDDPIQSVEVADVTIFPGAVPWQYDGASFAEHGFLLFPEIGTGTPSNAGGSLSPSQQYHYRIYFEWTDSLGRRHISTTGADIVVTTGAADNRATLTINTFAFTSKRKDVFAGHGNVIIGVFRNLGTGSTVYHRVSSVNPDLAPLNSQANDTLTFVDQMSDATAATQPLDPISESLSDNVALPASRVIANANSRTYAAGFDDDNEIWYSKLQGVGEPLQFSDVNQIELPAGRGPVTAMAELSDSLLVFRQTQVYQLGGEGLDDTGTSGGITTPRLVSDDVGCSEAASVVKTPIGVLFKSLKGIWLANADGVGYVGADVAAYNGETINAAIIMPTVNQVRFVTANRILVFDWELKRWTTWTVSGYGGALDAVLWRNTMVLLVNATGRLLQDQAGVYLDDGVPYSMAVETPWIKPAGSQGKARFYEALVLGRFLGTHQMLIRFAFDYNGFAEQHIWNPSAQIGQAAGNYGGSSYGTGVYGGTNASGEPASTVYQFSTKPARQRCQAFKARFETQALQGAGNPGATVALSEIAFTVGFIGDSADLGLSRKAA